MPARTLRHCMHRRHIHRRRGFIACVTMCCVFLTVIQSAAGADGSPSRLSDEPVPLIDPADVQRPKPLLELGNPFLGPGEIAEGIELPTGAVWQPSLLVFGTYRSAIQTFHDGNVTNAEWANRLDLFANLQLSATERLLVGIRPLDEDGRFSGVNIHGPPLGGQEEFDLKIETLFFEGDLGEIFANADPHDAHALDWGFSIGRQEFLVQDGLLVNDIIDAVGIVRNNILPAGGSNVRATFVYGWNQIHRDDNIDENGQHLIALLTQTDLAATTIDADFIYVYDDRNMASGFFWGVGGTQRLGEMNSTFRLLGSHALDVESPAVSSGYLLFSEFSWTMPMSQDLLYVNGFVGVDQFSSAARGPDRGGPLGRVGILFAAVELGRYGAPLGNRADDAVGGAVGYQAFLDEAMRQQLIVEIGARSGTTGADDAVAAIGARYQQAFGQHWVLQLDAFGSVQEANDPGWGFRAEIRFEF